MAKMYPPTVPPAIASSAEKSLFEVMRTQLGDDWIVLHSVGLTVHKKKPWAEIDFVVIGPPGVYCLEVKGGRVTRVNGKWNFIDRNNRVNSKDEGPFVQVGSASAALYNYLKTRLNFLGSTVCGYGVLFPDIEFKEHGPDIENRIIYDLRDSNRAFSSYLRRLADYWHERLETSHRPIEFLSDSNKKAILEEIRGDFDFRPSLNTQIGFVNNELVRLTTEQYKVLDGLEDNPRAIIRGGAGTGKTLLAMEEACRKARLGQKVLLCCYNKQLALHLKTVLQDFQGIDVYSLHSFMYSQIKEANLANQLPQAEADDLFTVFYPDYCQKALEKLDRFEVYDTIIVDEAQDLLLDNYFEVFDLVLKKGLKFGSWRFFLDPFQDIFNSKTSEGLKKLIDLQPVQYRLSINCRNTAPIATNVNLLSGIDCRDTLVVEGPEVEIKWYRDSGHQRREVSNLLNRILSQNVSPGSIVILSMRQLCNSCLSDGLVNVPYRIEGLEDPAITPTPGTIRFSTIKSFKGLEANVVIITDLDDISNKVASSLYVGGSRAKVFLAMFINESQNEEYKNLAFHFGQRLKKAGTITSASPTL